MKELPVRAAAILFPISVDDVIQWCEPSDLENVGFAVEISSMLPNLDMRTSGLVGCHLWPQKWPG